MFSGVWGPGSGFKDLCCVKWASSEIESECMAQNVGMEVEGALRSHVLHGEYSQAVCSVT